MDLLNLPWILYILIATVVGTLVGFIDNYVADVLFDDKHPQAEKMVAGPAYAVFGVVILAIFRPSFESIWPVLLLAGSGMVSSISSIFYFAGISKEETTTAKIFAQLIPVFALVLGWVFLGQKIDARQMLAFAIIMLAPIIVIASKDKRSKKTGGKAAIFFIIEAILVAVSSILFVQANNISDFNFLISMAIMMIGKGCLDMIIMGADRKWRRHFYNEVEKRKGKVIFVVLGNTVIWVFADTLYRFATVQADALALADVSYRAISLVMTFFLGVVLSLLWPNFGREKLTKRAVLAHLVATAVALIGIVLIG